MGILQQVRFIPTYVGYTYWLIYGASRRPVHPHIRGAYGVAERVQPTQSVHPHIRGAYDGDGDSAIVTSGSSPHTWGILGYRCTRRFWFAVHPHIRGAYELRFHRFRGYGGSSPHTWGILNVTKKNISRVRFIPTYVGHTPLPAGLPGFGPVHPHIRGAYGFHSVQSRVGFGSSPHTWGIRTVEQIAEMVGAVHPHIRGAYASD